MYSIVVQDELLRVIAVYVKNTLFEIQELLEELEPNMDAYYLITGEATILTFNNTTYSFHSVQETANVA